MMISMITAATIAYLSTVRMDSPPLLHARKIIISKNVCFFAVAKTVV